MKLITGLLNYSVPWALPNCYLFTGNPVVKNNGAIVMGRGAAKQVRDTFPGIDKRFGTKIRENPGAYILWLSCPFPGRTDATNPEQKIGWFKVKEHWADNAEISLIMESTARLTAVALNNPDLIFHMNYPGIGNGGIHISAIEHILKPLPDNVRIYK